MSIKGLTDRGLSFPEIGQIRKGAKKEANKPGADLTYFRVEFDEAEKKAAEDFNAAYGPKPTAIRIIFPFNDIDRMWDAWMEAYTAGRMVARSDGEFIVYQQDEQGNLMVKNGLGMDGKPVPHPANDIAGKDAKGKIVKFKPTGRLKVIVPELARAAYLTVMTTSLHDIQNISSQLAAFHNLNKGQIAGIPLILRRRPKEISTPTPEGNRVRRKKWLISIEADPEWVKAQLTTLKKLALPGNGLNLLGDGTHHDELETIEAEYDDDEIEATEEIAITVPEEEPTIELVDPMGMVQVQYAAAAWNISVTEAAKAIASRKLGKKIGLADFKKLVEG